MNELLSDFLQDADRVLAVIGVVESVRAGGARIVSPDAAAGQTEPPPIDHTDFVLIPGALLLYVVGRFEYCVRGLLVELAEHVANKIGSWGSLPERMRQSLIEATSSAMARKKSSQDSDIKELIRILSSNVVADDVSEINVNLLSSTDRNMRPDEISDLFGRIGATKLWDHVREKVALKVLFESASVIYVQEQAKARLNEIMETRNSVAHPRKGVTWPRADKTVEYIGFLKVLAEVLVDCVEEYKLELTTQGVGKTS